MSVSFHLNWRGAAIRGTYDPSPHGNRSDRVVLQADVPLFADKDRYLVIWFGPLPEPPSAESLADLAPLWLDCAAEKRGYHPDDVKRRQLSLFD